MGSHMGLSGPPFRRLVALMPSLTHLDLLVRSFEPLPQSIRSLSLGTCSAPRLLRYPNLTALSFALSEISFQPSKQFILLHSTQITELTVDDCPSDGVSTPDYWSLREAPWPAVRKLYLTCQHGFPVSALIKCMPSLTSLSLTLNVAEDFTGGREDSDSSLFPLSAEAALAALAVGPELSGLPSSLRVNVALLLCLLVQQGPVTLALYRVLSAFTSRARRLRA